MATHPKILADKAMAQFRAGQFNSAFKTAKIAAKEHPKESFFLNLAGLAQVQMGNPRDAIDWFRKAIRVSPINMDAHLNLLQTYAVLGERAHAVALADRILPKAQDREPILYLRAMAENAGGDPEAARATLDTLLVDYPKSARALNLRGSINVSRGEEGEAIADFQAALALNPSAPDTLSNLALLFARASRMEEALEHARRAASIAPQYQLGRQRLATLLTESGQAEEARRVYFEMLRDFPGNSEVLLDLAYLDTDDTRENIQSLVENALKGAKKGSADFANLMIARGRLLLRANDRAGSDQALAEGRAAHARLNPFDAARAETERREVMDMFPQGHKAPKISTRPGPRPIFVLGLPRSGTTLTEQVISSHPDVFGAGELPCGERAARAVRARGGVFDAEAAHLFAETYARHSPEIPPNVVAFVDKMPGNFNFTGMLLTAFPNAIVLHMRRDPRDVALSMWHAILGSGGMLYTYDQRAMAGELNAYRRQMLDWEARFPGQIHDVHYETLVSDIEGESRRLAALCGLEWVPEMMRPHENSKAVRTASLMQVRQPVSTKSVGGWKRHESALAEVIAGLDPLLWPELAE